MKTLFGSKTIAFLAICASAATICSCEKDEDNNNQNPTVHSGLYIFNQGNYPNKIDGSLDILSLSTREMSHKAFANANGRKLGGTPNSFALIDSLLFIASTDENRIEIVSTYTLKSKKTIEVVSPREIVADGSNIYVSTYQGKVYEFSSDGKEIAKSEKIGEYLEGIAVNNGYVYVCNSYNQDYTYNNNVVKLSKDLKKVKDITVVVNPNVISAYGENLYVASFGDYYSISSSIQKIDKEDNVQSLLPGTAFTISNDKIFSFNSTYDANYNVNFEYNIYDLKTSKKKQFISSTEVDYANNISSNPKDGHIFIVSNYWDENKQYGDYSRAGFVAEFDENGNKLAKYETGVGPYKMLFVE